MFMQNHHSERIYEASTVNLAQVECLWRAFKAVGIRSLRYTGKTVAIISISVLSDGTNGFISIWSSFAEITSQGAVHD